jgi:hypothetical protein
LADAFVVQDPLSHQWCVFSSEQAWMFANVQRRARVVGKIAVIEGHARHIELTEAGESGDWFVRDTYEILVTGRVRQLVRSIRMLSYDITVDQSFASSGRELRELEFVARSMSSGQHVARDQIEWTPSTPIYRSLKEFPFGEMLGKPAPMSPIDSCD